MNKKELAIQVASVLAQQPDADKALPLCEYKDVRVDVGSPSFSEALRTQVSRHYAQHSYVGRILAKPEYGSVVPTKLFIVDQVVCDPNTSPAEAIHLKVVENLMFSDRNFERELHVRSWARDKEKACLSFPEECEKAKEAGAQRLWIPSTHWIDMLNSSQFIDRMMPLTDRAQIMCGSLGVYNGCEVLTDSFECVPHKVLRGDTSWAFESQEKMGEFSCELTKLKCEENAKAGTIAIHMWVEVHMHINDGAWFEKVNWTYK